MSKSVIEAIEDLVGKVPDIEQQIAQVRQKQAVKPAADIAWVYNGYGDVTFDYLGQYKFHFPFGEVTKVSTLHDHREIVASESIGQEIVFRSHPIKGEWIARELIETRQFSDKGMAVFFNKDGVVPADLKQKCDEEGYRFAMSEIERYKISREKAKAGVPGYGAKPSLRVYTLLQKYAPDDEVFAEQSRKTDTAKTMADAIAQLTKYVTLSEERNNADLLSAKFPPGYPVRRNALESPEGLQKRQAEFLLEMLSKPEAEPKE